MKKKFPVAIIAIIAYVVGMSLAKQQEDNVYQAIAALILSLALFGYLAYSKSFKTVGFVGVSKKNLKKVLYFIPLIALTTVNLWNGVAKNLSTTQSLYMVLTMLLTGFLEEVIFRGLLFQAILEDNEKQALVITSVTFGLGHIVNLLSGAEFGPTILQLIYAIAIGFMLGMLVLKTKSIIAAMVFHSVFNMISVFGNNGGLTMGIQILITVAICLVCFGYCMYLKKIKVNEA